MQVQFVGRIYKWRDWFRKLSEVLGALDVKQISYDLMYETSENMKGE